MNPQVAFADLGVDTLPSLLSLDGPVREARFIRNPDGSPDGGVHAIFTITGRTDAVGCQLEQPDFEVQLARHNVSYRIPTPMFGMGLIEQIPDASILANQAADEPRKRRLGIRGKANIEVASMTVSGTSNTNGNDGTVTRFGWKAQNKSIMLFAGEAYNVKMGISNDLFPNERDETPECQFTAAPNDQMDLMAATPAQAISGLQAFTLFGRFLAPPVPSPDTPGGADSIANGHEVFEKVGCDLCHTQSFMTAESESAALSEQEVVLDSDLLVHDMGPGLADGISQGQAGPSEFRTAPLWGVGQQLFFLHDGRTSNIAAAIHAHRSGQERHASEANGVIGAFVALPAGD